ncbi:MAG: hypothetical protein Q7S95_00295 [bacterium]|nr:hypothetical protein [bacterium]
MRFRIFGLSITNANEKNRFGLVQAEAAMQFVREPSQIKSVNAVVCGVLGYENTVAADVAQATLEVVADIANDGDGVVANQERIAELEHRIAILQAQVKRSSNRQAELQQIAELFAN